jgi:hypothetical protein
MLPVTSTRKVKGANLLGLVKLVKSYRKTHAIDGLSASAESLLADHVLASEWYPFAPFTELIELVDREILKRSDEHALQMGIAGGRVALDSFHKGFIRPGDPVATLFAMRAAWPFYFDFGDLQTAKDGSAAVRFSVNGYPDVSRVHGQLILGWHVSAALVSGSDGASGEILEAPWKGDLRLVHRVRF